MLTCNMAVINEKRHYTEIELSQKKVKLKLN